MGHSVGCYTQDALNVGKYVKISVSLRDFSQTGGSLTNSAKNIHEDLSAISLFPCFI